MIAMIENGEITSVPVHLHPEVERRMSLASSYTANNSRKSSSNSASSRKSSSSNSSRKSSRVTFAPNLIQDGSRKGSSQSLPLASALANSSRKNSSEVNSRKSSSKSEGAVASVTSRKVSFVDELTGAPARPDPKFERELQAQLEIVKEAGEMGEFMS